MFDNYTLDELEVLKIVLTFVGTGSSLLLGIIGTSVDSYKEITISKGGKEIKERKTKGWFWLVISGLLAGFLITSSASYIDKKIYELKEKISDHPFFPFTLKTVIKVIPSFEEGEEAALMDIKKYFSDNSHNLKLPPDYTILTDMFATKIYYGGNVPFTPIDTSFYDQKINKLNNYLFRKILPYLKFSLFDIKSDTLNKQTPIYSFNAGSSILSQNLLRQPFQSANCKLSYFIDYDNSMIIVYTAPTSSWATNAIFKSLYGIKNGFIIIQIDNSNSPQKDIQLIQANLYCGEKQEIVPIFFNENDTISFDKNKLTKTYIKAVADFLKPEVIIRY